MRGGNENPRFHLVSRNASSFPKMVLRFHFYSFLPRRIHAVSTPRETRSGAKCPALTGWSSRNGRRRRARPRPDRAGRLQRRGAPPCRASEPAMSLPNGPDAADYRINKRQLRGWGHPPHVVGPLNADLRHWNVIVPGGPLRSIRGNHCEPFIHGQRRKQLPERLPRRCVRGCRYLLR